MKGYAKGNIELSCYKCGSSFDKKIELELDFLISNGLYNGDNQDVVYESIDSIIDLQEIFDSEIEIICNDYNSCDECENTDTKIHLDI